MTEKILDLIEKKFPVKEINIGDMAELKAAV